MEKTLLSLIIGIVTLGYLLERVLSLLNRKHWSVTLPAGLEGIYDAGRYRQSQEYFRANQRLSMYSGSFSTLLIVLVLLTGGFGLLDQWVRTLTQHPVGMSLLFFAILLFAFDILGLPFSLYDTFVIEERFGFNRTSPKTFVTDKIKTWLLGAVIGGGLLALVIWFWQLTGRGFWIWALALVAAFMVFMAMFYSSLIVPLFNKQTPLEEGELRDAIRSLSHSTGFRLDDVYVIDGSKRSTKANAYFSGLGKKKRIVLFDTLLADLSVREIIAVLAHEIGHYRKKHTLAGLGAGVVQLGLVLFLLSRFINNPALSAAMGSAGASFHLGLLAFGLLYNPVAVLLGLAVNYLSRRHEYAADKFAAEHARAADLVSALKKLSAKNLSNLNPHPAYVFFHYSHPPLLKRIRALTN